MNDLAAPSAYGALTEASTVRIQRLLPGPIGRVWDYLTDSGLRRQWLAAGEMELKAGAAFELVWRNDELSQSSANRPAGFSEEQRMQSRITEIDPPRKLAITWDSSDGVTFELEPKGADVLLTVTHHRMVDRPHLLGVSAGWHAHLDVLAARLRGEEPPSFWEGWTRLRKDYDRRLPA